MESIFSNIRKEHKGILTWEWRRTQNRLLVGYIRLIGKYHRTTLELVTNYGSKFWDKKKKKRRQANKTSAAKKRMIMWKAVKQEK